MTQIPRKIGGAEMVDPPASPDNFGLYFCDASDVANLPLDVAPGSMAMTVDTAERYIFHDGAWVEFGRDAGSAGN